ncbi:Ribosomal protein S18 acetylase RimI [Abditibacterium utsteinense]|uniref:Ribosomal protein S18 acetylase RimI n=1 Tax=Abditibacterium utsteinense TaxID=1960156 RepID=A0A2S8SX30_9BACT|nr:GNAT family N-acetyltransferase [Abditibacterium utsteinense]PQV65355.1 Ribosomal protein S18 acetylase RimI [Abditibacterium utsteinense]
MLLSVQPANSSDFPAIIELQERNHLSNLAENARDDGFVTTYLDTPKLEFLRAQNGLFIAKIGAELAGFACAQNWDLSGTNAFHRAVLSGFPLNLKNSAITAENSFLYGPVCVAASFRGRGILGDLIEAVKAAFRPRYNFGVSFIDHRNLRSLAAHTRKLGFQIVGELPFDDTIYHVLGFSTSSSL